MNYIKQINDELMAIVYESCLTPLLLDMNHNFENVIEIAQKIKKQKIIYYRLSQNRGIDHIISFEYVIHFVDLSDFDYFCEPRYYKTLHLDRYNVEMKEDERFIVELKFYSKD